MQIQITPRIAALHEKAKKIGSFEVLRDIEWLQKNGNINIGYRACCGTTHTTQKYFRIWRMVVKELQKQGIQITEESIPQKHGAGTMYGGFYQEYQYTIQTA